MRRLVLLVLLAPLAASIGCGGDDPAPVFVDLQWRVRCHLSGGCSNTEDHDINNLDNEDGHDLSCSVSDTGGGNRLLLFSAFKGTDYGIRLRGAIFASPGGPVMGTGCILRFEEQGLEYQAGCTSSPPSDSNQCQVTNLLIEDAADGPTVTGDLRCEQAPAVADRMITRELTGPGPGVEGEMSLARFRIVNCVGL